MSSDDGVYVDADFPARHQRLKNERDSLLQAAEEAREMLRVCELLLPINYPHAPPGASGGRWNARKDTLARLDTAIQQAKKETP